ncbi:alpha-glucosidase [Pararhodobacter zhoushanensis]|uniref:alpha-glucosidase n=1 Tax=Pararhodobacter zhoushanensis TaxID=2479545 RepID=UPI000F8CFAE5|nr:alpha-glucosidase [Pararhodobacter zhoushanensis]
MNEPAGLVKAQDRDWWRGAVIYQIYPRSFQDSNGDGIGDLAGIIQRLPHIAELGVDAIWISPFFRSPMVDFGYDVSDYRDVDQIFGTLGDFDALIERAHQLGLKVLIDLVLSHTSEQHAWFRESRSGQDNAKSDWYVWADAKPDGTQPNNWLSIFGGPAWEWSTERQQYYLHNFLVEQPDLNLHNPDVQDELLNIVRFWLDRGVDGFRLDTVNLYFHDPELRNNPVLPIGERNEILTPSVNPYNWQDHLYDKNRPENLAFLKRLRAVLDEYPATTSVGEVSDAQRGLAIQSQYTSGDDMLHMCYDFAFLSGTYPTGDRVADVLDTFGELGPESWACWAFSNHDVMRHISRWELPKPAIRTFAALLLSLRGSVCLYQGEELGLSEAYVPFEELQDPYGIRFWPKYHGRDGCRTPIPWVHDGVNGGFSTAKPWLPLPVDHLEHAVARQTDDWDSMLRFYRKMIAYRQSREALRTGSFEVIERRPEMLSFIRRSENETLFCAFALSDEPQAISLPPGRWQADDSAPFRATLLGPERTLEPWQVLYALKKD